MCGTHWAEYRILIQQSRRNWILSPKLFPILENKSGSGSMAKEMNASKELPHPNPSALYIDGPARGNTAPMSDLKTVFAAAADAASNLNASTR